MALMSVAQRRRPSSNDRCAVRLHIDNDFTARVYTSGSTISGHVIIQAASPLSFANFDILFTGAASTALDIEERHELALWHFLLIKMPIPDGILPRNKVLEKGRTYTIPFHFVVPRRLAIGSCNHKCGDKHVLEQHTRPPPSMAACGAAITYSIKARLTLSYLAGYDGIPTIEARHGVRILPATLEDPPLDVLPCDKEYRTSATRRVKTSFFPLRGGTLTAAAFQPRAVMLSQDGQRTSVSFARVILEFRPFLDATPVKINSLSAKIVVVTILSTLGLNYIPGLTDRPAGEHTSTRTTTSKLFRSRAGNMLWTQNECDWEAHTLGNATNADALPVAARRVYRTVLDVPFTLPLEREQLPVPTFHSCLVSRVYKLQLRLFVGPMNTVVPLELPLQVGVDADDTCYDENMAPEEMHVTEEGNAGLPPKYDACPRLIIRYA